GCTHRRRSRHHLLDRRLVTGRQVDRRVPGDDHDRPAGVRRSHNPSAARAHREEPL
ncbi:MAG: hypothetical protein AVDCRST_MAG69-1356, partial [uncultured Solirubrobacteraceae bacterium]